MIRGRFFIRLPDGQLHAVPWALGEHGLRPFDELLRRRTGTVLAHRAASGGAVAVEPGGLSVYDAEAEAGQW